MSSHVVCPNCGARNAVGAPWCGQCYRPLGEDEDAVQTMTGVTDDDQMRLDLSLPNVPRIGEESWSCAVCGTTNPLAESNCAACGTSIFETFAADQSEPSNPRSAVLRGLLLPGFGHGVAGQTLLGATVAALVVVAMTLGIMLLVHGAVTAGILLVLIAVGVWVVGAADAYRWARGEQAEVVLRPRVLTVLVGVVFVVLIVVAVSTQGAR
jgi:ribosomal protein L40E